MNYNYKKDVHTRDYRRFSATYLVPTFPLSWLWLWPTVDVKLKKIQPWVRSISIWATLTQQFCSWSKSCWPNFLLFSNIHFKTPFAMNVGTITPDLMSLFVLLRVARKSYTRARDSKWCKDWLIEQQLVYSFRMPSFQCCSTLQVVFRKVY